MSSELSIAQRAKFDVLFEGVTIAPGAERFIMAQYGERPLTLADYASTSGISLELDDNVWVNAPIAGFNPNMVFDPRYELRLADDRLALADTLRQREMPAKFVPVPAYHDQRNAHGEPFTDYVHTHTDRARLSPVRGCAMRCQFCDIPYEFKGRYFPKPISMLLEAAACALADPVQPASHLLISGGTPARRDYDYLKQVYRSVISAFPDTDVDIMMVPSAEIIDLDELSELGVHELSLNIELWDPERARRIMPEKATLGREAQLAFIARGVERLGPGRVRSMLMVGLEETETTIEAVERLAQVGCVPVLSPFRPDPITTLAHVPPPTAEVMIDTYLRARDAAGRFGVKLGPSCIPCSHNTLTLADGSADYSFHQHQPNRI